MKFNELLKKVATERGLSQAEIARRSGLSTSLIARYWTGENLPSVEKLGKLAHAMQCDPGELVPMPEDEEAEQEPEKARCSA